MFEQRDNINASTGLPLGGGGWFALRSVSNGRLVQMAPLTDDEAWVIRARGGAIAPSTDDATRAEAAAAAVGAGEVPTADAAHRASGGGDGNITQKKVMALLHDEQLMSELIPREDPYYQ